MTSCVFDVLMLWFTLVPKKVPTSFETPTFFGCIWVARRAIKIYDGGGPKPPCTSYNRKHGIGNFLYRYRKICLSERNCKQDIFRNDIFHCYFLDYKTVSIKKIPRNISPLPFWNCKYLNSNILKKQLFFIQICVCNFLRGFAFSVFNVSGLRPCPSDCFMNFGKCSWDISSWIFELETRQCCSKKVPS